MQKISAHKLNQLAWDHSPEGVVKILNYIQDSDVEDLHKIYLLQEMIRATSQNVLENLPASTLGEELVRRAEAKANK